MKILLVTDNRYWRESIGSQKRIAALCTHLARGHQLEVLFLGRLTEEDAKRLNLPLNMQRADLRSNAIIGSVGLKASSAYVAAKRFAKQVLVESRRLVSSPGYRVGCFRRFSLQINEPKLSDFHHADWARKFSEACRRFEPDAIVVEYVRLAWLLDRCSSDIPSSCLIAIDTHDVQSRRQSLFHKHDQIHDLDITPQEEARALSLGHVAIAIQKNDALELRRMLPSIKVIVAAHPNPVVPITAPQACHPIRFAFFGSSMAPNRDALERLLSILWPAARRMLPPDAELLIFGGVGDLSSNLSCDSGVRIMGFAPDLAGAYSSAHVILNPVNYGGGLKIKSVEALCFGKPLVTTAVGAEGLADGAGVAFIQADTDREFVAAMIELALSMEKRDSLSRAAIAFAKEYFSPDHVFDELDGILTRRHDA